MQQPELGQSTLVNAGVKLPRFLCSEQQPAQTEVSLTKLKSMLVKVSLLKFWSNLVNAAARKSDLPPQVWRETEAQKSVPNQDERER